MLPVEGRAVYLYRPVLLGIQRYSGGANHAKYEDELSNNSEDGEAVGVNGSSPHSDEAQVLLDTKRSFVTYPRGMSLLHHCR